MKKYKIGIIGCGGIAFGKHMPSLFKIPERCEMVAFCDLEIDKAQRAAERYGAPGAKITTDYKEIANDPDIDIIHVCTPNRSHSFITIDCLRAGKHVMCEKPMAKTAAEAKQMLEVAKETGKKLTIGYQNRQGWKHLKLKQMCENGELGEVYYAKAHAVRDRDIPSWGVFLNKEEQGGGPLIDIGTHALDLTLWAMNNYEPAMVVGSTFRKLADTAWRTNGWGPYDPKTFDVEDSAFGFIKMKNGATIVLESSWALNVTKRDRGEACTTLCGTKAGASTKSGFSFVGDAVNENGEYYYKDDSIKEEDTVALFAEDGDYDADDMCKSDMLQWLNAIENDTDPCVLPEQAYIVSLILESIYESAKTGKPVYFD